MMKSLMGWEWAGAAWIMAAGSLLHFVYSWSGYAPWVGYFAPVNESPWEHLKLLFVPALLFGGAESRLLRKRRPGLFPVKCLGALVGTAAIPLFYGAYTAMLGHHVFLLDMASFLVGIGTVWAVDRGLLRRREPLSPLLSAAAVIGVSMLLLTFATLSFHAPGYGFFLEPAK